MSDAPIVLDDRRGMAAQRATEIRRHLAAVRANQAALEAELEKVMAAAPAQTWAEAAEKACYLIELFAATPDAEDPGRQRLIARVLDDFRRFTDGPQDRVDGG